MSPMQVWRRPQLPVMNVESSRIAMMAKTPNNQGRQAPTAVQKPDENQAIQVTPSFCFHPSRN